MNTANWTKSLYATKASDESITEKALNQLPANAFLWLMFSHGGYGGNERDAWCYLGKRSCRK